MIITGVFYALIGIKTQRLHIFFSTAYLFSLAVTVLIEYVMHPPISNGVQAAYFIAACATGLAFGSVAMVFADVTEGLGCLLGGFCLSMWFLVLKPGGLLTSTAGKAIFIACFTVSTFALYISHYTRPYGIIGSTSFAGASVVVLGIDCFSRAGLKEFWLYIWGEYQGSILIKRAADRKLDLNDNIFPLNYRGPYPITRGIRVEIACIIFIFVLGVMSQMKVWNIVKQRREARAAEQRRQEEEREKADEDMGRRLEADNEQQRAMWDAVYGGKDKSKGSHLDSGIGTDAPSSVRKSSVSIVSVRDIPEEGMEMQDLNGSHADNGGKFTVHVVQDEITELSSAAGESSPKSVRQNSREPSIPESQVGGAKSIHSVAASTKPMVKDDKKAKVGSKKTSKVTSKPTFVPLPFRVPTDSEPRKDDDTSSVATFAASEHHADRATKSLSRLSLMRKLSGRSHRRNSSLLPGPSEEALITSHGDGDRADSIAATLDGISDKAGSDGASSSSKRQSSEPRDSNTKETVMTPIPVPGTPSPVEASMSKETNLDSGSGINANPTIMDLSNSGHVVIEDASERQTLARESRSIVPSEMPDKDMSEKERSVGADAVSEKTGLQPSRATLAKDLPKGASKVEMAYRTNEWAKHLDRAEAPDLEELKIRESQKAPSADAKEPSAPVNVQALQQTALTAEPAPDVVLTSNAPSDKSRLPSMNRTTSAPSVNNPYRTQQSPRQSRSNSQTSLVSSTGSHEDLSRPSLTRTRGNQSTLSAPRGFRSSSSPLVGSPLASSPIEEDVEATFPSTFVPSSAHLMSQRDTLIRNKPSSTSLLRVASASSFHRSTANNSPGASTPALTILDEGDDNMSLAERRSLLQQDPSRVSIVDRNLSGGTVSPANASRLSLAHYATDSNNPYRQSVSNSNPPHSARVHSIQDPAAVTSWRASLAQLPNTAELQHAAEMERRRLDLLAEKQAQRRSRAVEAGQNEQRQSVLGKEMRRGSMLDAHREAMRRMQGQVNESLKS